MWNFYTTFQRWVPCEVCNSIMLFSLFFSTLFALSIATEQQAFGFYKNRWMYPNTESSLLSGNTQFRIHEIIFFFSMGISWVSSVLTAELVVLLATHHDSNSPLFQNTFESVKQHRSQYKFLQQSTGYFLSLWKINPFLLCFLSEHIIVEQCSTLPHNC